MAEPRLDEYLGTVVSVRLHTGDGLLADAPVLEAIAGRGFKGDVKAGAEGRHVLLCDDSTIAACGFSPGDLQEQLTVDLPALQSLAAGARLRTGEALLRITEDCEPCKLFARRKGGGEDPRGFIRRMQGKRGMLAVVIEGGRIRPGDRVEVVESAAESGS